MRGRPPQKASPWLGIGTPKLWTALEGYTAQKALSDVTAGVTVGLVALPLAMAFAISSGLTPEAGIYTARKRLRQSADSI